MRSGFRYRAPSPHRYRVHLRVIACACIVHTGQKLPVADRWITSAPSILPTPFLAHLQSYPPYTAIPHYQRTLPPRPTLPLTAQGDGRWVLFDDDTLSFKKDEDIIALSGGGDWHMAYMMVYRAVTAPTPAAAVP